MQTNEAVNGGLSVMVNTPMQLSAAASNACVPQVTCTHLCLLNASALTVNSGSKNLPATTSTMLYFEVFHMVLQLL